VARPDRVPVVQPLGVVPHAVAVDQARAGGGGDVEHPAVDVGGHAGDHVPRRSAQPLRPVAADQVVVAADAAGRDDHRLRGQLESRADLPAGGDTARGMVVFQQSAAHAGDRIAGHDEFVDAVPVMEGQQVPLDRPARADDERLDHSGATTPGEVEARHRIAVAVRAQAAAFGPADQRCQRDAVAVEPAAFLTGGPLDVGASPAHRPGVLVVKAVELGAALPVGPGQVERVLDAKVALLWRADQEQPAERPPGLPAEVGRVLLIDERDPAAGAGQLVRGDQPGQPVSDDNNVSIHAHVRTSPRRPAAPAT
jgi:hypothetical protein